MGEMTPYQLIGGEAGVRALADAFYGAMDELPEARTIRAMHKDSLDEIRQKLFEYLNGWLGGPHLYREKYGGICLTGPHRPYAIGPDERDQWITCWNRALDRIDAPVEFRDMVREPIFRMASFMINRESAAPA